MKATNSVTKASKTASTKGTRAEAKQAKKAKKADKADKADKTDKASLPVPPAAMTPTVGNLVLGTANESVVRKMRARITPKMIASLELSLASQPSDDVPVGMPIGTFCKEAVGVAAFAERYWQPVEGIDACLAPHEARLGGDPGPQLVFLTDQFRQADAMLVQGSLPTGDPLQPLAQKQLTEIRSACEVVVDDGVQDKKDVMVVALRKQHASAPKTVGELTNALASYVTAARSLSAELEALPGFDMRVLDAAQNTVDHLLGRGNGASNEATRPTRIRRNRLLSMIRARVATIRKVGKFAFRNYPDILREMASAYNRDRRRAAKRGELDGAGEEEGLPVPTEEQTPIDTKAAEKAKGNGKRKEPTPDERNDESDGIDDDSMDDGIDEI